MNCRACDAVISNVMVDLCNAPPSNSFLKTSQLKEPEVFYPLKVFVCEKCWFVQIDEVKKNSEIFSEDYIYFSSYSSSWLIHCESYVQSISHRLNLDESSFVIEVASNDGYLLQFFKTLNIPCLGIEPSQKTAEVALAKGISTEIHFWTKSFAEKLLQSKGQADLLLGNNVLAHVPNIHDFLEAFKTALKPTGTITFEFPHLLNLIKDKQFDTIYHEHYSYLSLHNLTNLLKKHDLDIYDVEKIPVHGGSLRVYLKHSQNTSILISPTVNSYLNEETKFGLTTKALYQKFQKEVEDIRCNILSFLCEQNRLGKTVVAYGAAAKGNTLLNYCGIKGTQFIQYIVDKSPHKQGLYTPGSHLHVYSPKHIAETKPDYVIIMPWNLKNEIMAEMDYIREWGGRFVTFIPKIDIL